MAGLWGAGSLHLPVRRLVTWWWWSWVPKFSPWNRQCTSSTFLGAEFSEASPRVANPGLGRRATLSPPSGTSPGTLLSIPHPTSPDVPPVLVGRPEPCQGFVLRGCPFSPHPQRGARPWLKVAHPLRDSARVHRCQHTPPTLPHPHMCVLLAGGEWLSLLSQRGGPEGGQGQRPPSSRPTVSPDQPQRWRIPSYRTPAVP
jgi:hypothetical protein